MNRKKLLSCLCLAILLIFCLSGCGKNKVAERNQYPADEIMELKIDADTWNTDIMASSDEKIHISFDGSISNKDPKPTVTLQDGTLSVMQNSSDEGLVDQIALGKKGQINIYLPSNLVIPISMNNGIGDIEAGSISTTDFQLVNSAGYVTFADFTANHLNVSSGAGDITVKDADITNSEVITSSGYVKFSNTIFSGIEIATQSGEINLYDAGPEANINLQTGSGDINLNYQTMPDNLDFGITSGSKDISVRFSGAVYTKETTECKQGVIGDGQYKLEVNSDNGTVVVK